MTLAACSIESSDQNQPSPGADSASQSASATQSTGVLVATGAKTIVVEHRIGGAATGCGGAADGMQLTLASNELTRLRCDATSIPGSAPLTATQDRTLTKAERARIDDALSTLYVGTNAAACSGSFDGDYYVLHVTTNVGSNSSFSDADEICLPSGGQYLTESASGLYDAMRWAMGRAELNEHRL
jgi:hypothetical protein